MLSVFICDSKQEYLKREWRECAGLSKNAIAEKTKTMGRTDFGHFQTYMATVNLLHDMRVYRTKLEISIHHGMFFYVSFFHSLTSVIISFLSPFIPAFKSNISPANWVGRWKFLLKCSLFRGQLVHFRVCVRPFQKFSRPQIFPRRLRTWEVLALKITIQNAWKKWFCKYPRCGARRRCQPAMLTQIPPSYIIVPFPSPQEWRIFERSLI